MKNIIICSNVMFAMAARHQSKDDRRNKKRSNIKAQQTNINTADRIITSKHIIIIIIIITIIIIIVLWFVTHTVGFL